MHTCTVIRKGAAFEHFLAFDTRNANEGELRDTYAEAERDIARLRARRRTHT